MSRSSARPGLWPGSSRDCTGRRGAASRSSLELERDLDARRNRAFGLEADDDRLARLGGRDERPPFAKSLDRQRQLLVELEDLAGVAELHGLAGGRALSAP